MSDSNERIDEIIRNKGLNRVMLKLYDSAHLCECSIDDLLDYITTYNFAGHYKERAKELHGRRQG
jgi:hypothetical protein